MPVYTVAGTVLDIDLEVPELAPAPGPSDSAWTVRRSDELADGELERITELRLPSGTLWGIIETGDHGYRLTYPDRAEVDVEPAARRVRYRARPELSELTVSHLLVNQVLPYLLVADGVLVLHAACVALDGKAVAFVGPTGMGKSSLAAAFVQRGAPLLADDIVPLVEQEDGTYLVAPVYPGLRLWPDSADFFAGAAEELPTVADYTDKRRWDGLGGPSPELRLPLVAVVAPGNEPEPGHPEVRIGRLRGADAFMTLAEQAFRLERRGRARHDADLARFTQLAERVPVHLIEYQRRYDLLPKVLEAIEEAVGLET